MQHKKNKIINIVASSIITILFLVTATLFYYPKPINNLFIIDKIIIEGSIKSNQNKIKKDVEEFSRYLIGLNSRFTLNLH